jgi:putative tryptophan/tyrosine transport system substrate-binding protein
MKKKILVALFPTLVITFVYLAEAQQPAKVPRIGFLTSGAATRDSSELFRQGLGELGYVEGKNILIEYRYAEGGIAVTVGVG